MSMDPPPFSYKEDTMEGDIRMLVIGFWPGLWDPNQVGFKPFEIKDIGMVTDKLKYLEGLPCPDLKAVMWGIQGNKVIAGVVTTMAEELFTYMRYFSENDPTGWFHVDIKCTPKGYDFHLAVNHHRSAKRMSKIHRVKPENMQIVHRRLVCEVPQAEALPKVKSLLVKAKEMEVRLLDFDQITIKDGAAPGGIRLTDQIDPSEILDRTEFKFKHLKCKFSDN